MIQLFGTNKCKNTKKAQMWFKERRINFQFINLNEKEMSKGEFDSVFAAIKKQTGNAEDALDLMIDKESKDYAQIAYLDNGDKKDKLFENQNLLKLPVVRKDKTQATVGLAQDIWKTWN